MVTSTGAALDTLERVGTALSDPTRRRILLELLQGPAYPADLAARFSTGRTNISNHLSCLRGCGLASARLAHAIGDLVELELEIAPHEDLDGRS
jgi:ArsR family transcriptional regulator, cadmium/lead-responsive transcriptional repressor